MISLQISAKIGPVCSKQMGFGSGILSLATFLANVYSYLLESAMKYEGKVKKGNLVKHIADVGLGCKVDTREGGIAFEDFVSDMRHVFYEVGV